MVAAMEDMVELRDRVGAFNANGHHAAGDLTGPHIVQG